jgi:hypothetical protein
MKRLFILVILSNLLCASIASAETRSLTASWEHPAADYPRISSWSLYMGDSCTTLFRNQEIDHPDNLPLKSKQVTVTVTGTPGSTVKKWFALSAWDRADGKETKLSECVSADFVIPALPLTAPSKFTLTVILGTP